MKTTPTPEQFEIALLWLQSNEGTESPACLAVANWIESWRTDQMIKATAREGGVSVKELRRRLAEGGMWK